MIVNKSLKKDRKEKEMKQQHRNIETIARKFAPGSMHLVCEPYGNGHINDTYRVRLTGIDAPGKIAPEPSTSDDCSHAGLSGDKDCFILQKINSHVFHRPDQVMENVLGVTGWIRDKLIRQGEDPCRRVLTVLPAEDGLPYWRDPQGEYWQACRFIPDAVCYEQAPDEETFYQSALSFGNFQNQLSDYPAGTLYETIPGFHNTPARFRQFLAALQEDKAGRVKNAAPEIAFLTERASLTKQLAKASGSCLLPLRVTHNDTKLNNVMMDAKSGKGICVIDLDTVMPGLSVTDFGDAIRFGASTAAEDEPDLSRVHFDRHLYEVYREGFIEGCAGALTKEEITMLPAGAMVITCEQALRFLTDYLNGDIYYKTARPEHNLDRARTQIRLLAEMEKFFA